MTQWASLASNVVIVGVLLSLLGMGALVNAPRRLGWARLTATAGYGLTVAGALLLLVLARGWRGAALMAGALFLGIVVGSLTRLRR